jgi:protein PhnA
MLAGGNSVLPIKDLKVKGANVALKRGTVIKSIRLTDDEKEIEGKSDKVKGLVLQTEFVKKVWAGPKTIYLLMRARNRNLLPARLDPLDGGVARSPLQNDPGESSCHN